MLVWNDSGIDPALALTIRLTLAALFAAAAAHKFSDLRGFSETLSDYRLLPDALVPLAAALLIAAEALTVLALLLPTLAMQGLRAAAGLLLIYGLAIGLNLLRGRRNIDCGCTAFDSGQPISGWLVMRNLVLAGVAGFALLQPGIRILNLWDYAIAIFAGCAFYLLYAAVNQLLANAPRLALLRTGHE